MQQRWRLGLPLVLGLMSHSLLLFGAPTPQTLFQRLTGRPLLKSDPRYNELKDLMAAGKTGAAANLAMGDAGFLDVVVRDMAAELSNRKETPLVELNDFTALFIGVARDDLDARLLLTGNFRYEAKPEHKLPEVSLASNAHFTELEKRGLSLKESLRRVEPQWPGWKTAAGLLTTRTWALEHLLAGTNRRATEFAFREFMCAPIETWRMPDISDHRIRHDVDRKPGGDPSRYDTECRTCHAMLDGLTGAWADMDFLSGKLVRSKGWISPKMNQNSDVSPEKGHATFDNSWVNLAVTQQHLQLFGWRGALEGSGVEGFGRLLSDSKRFSVCLGQRIFQRVCRKKPTATDFTTIHKLASEFESEGYVLRKLFEKISSLNSCYEES